jgi:hypothetical protein
VVSGKERMTICTEVLVKEFDDWRSESSRSDGITKARRFQTQGLSGEGQGRRVMTVLDDRLRVDWDEMEEMSQ